LSEPETRRNLDFPESAAVVLNLFAAVYLPKNVSKKIPKARISARVFFIFFANVRIWLVYWGFYREFVTGKPSGESAIERALTPQHGRVTVRHMKTISIRELHARTGEVVRQASRYGEIQVTDNGRVVAKIIPHNERSEEPYFARRQPSAAFKKLDQSGKTGGGTDSTIAISEDREDRN
jgi:prevent-host-death family protein